jgi:hypothetical protein
MHKGLILSSFMLIINPGVRDKDTPSKCRDDFNSIPCDEMPEDVPEPEMNWSTPPNECIPGVPDEDIPFDHPDMLNVSPRDGQPGQGVPNDDFVWICSVYMPVKEEDVDAPFDRPGDTLQVAGICLIDIQHMILVRLLASFGVNLYVQFDDLSPAALSTGDFYT